VTPDHPRDLSAFREALLEGDRRLTRRRARRRAVAATAAVLVAAIALPLTLASGPLDAAALASQAREALRREGVMHVTVEAGDQRIERWSEGERIHTHTNGGGRARAEQVSGPDGSRVRFAPDWRLRTVPGGGPTPADDPVARYRALLDRAGAGDVEEVAVGGVPAYRVTVPARGEALPQVVDLRRSDKLPIAARFGTTTVRFRDIAWSRDRSALDLCHRPPGGSSEPPCDPPSSSP
jgi:hypothetical protein